MLQVFIEMSDHAEAKRLTEWKERVVIETVELSMRKDHRVAAVWVT